MDEIVIVPYNLKWNELFEQEAERLHHVFRDEQPAIEHIGSTSIVGMDAKPILDIIVGFQTLEAERIIKKLEALGYEFWKEDTYRNERLFFTKWDSDKVHRLIHIHATTIGNDFWIDQITFRNILRIHSEIAKEYSALKKELALRYKSDRDGYTSAKTEFVRRVLRDFAK